VSTARSHLRDDKSFEDKSDIPKWDTKLKLQVYGSFMNVLYERKVKCNNDIRRFFAFA